MEMIVCVKQVPDPEAPPASFRVDPGGTKMAVAPGVPQVVSTFDEYALEAALRIKDAQGGRITVLSMGGNLLRDVVKKPLAMGADRLVLLEDPAYEGGDSWSTAYALAMAIRKIGTYDLILCGRQSADWDAGQVGIGIAELLGITGISVVKSIEIVGQRARAKRLTATGYEVVEAVLPLLVTLGSEIGKPRYTTLEGIMTAGKKEVLIWKPADIGVRAGEIGISGRRVQLVRLSEPHHENVCEMIEGETPEEMGVTLAVKLREAKIL